MKFIRSQLLEVIEWKDDTRDTIVYQFPVGKSEIKNGASLTVRESQIAVFVCNGQIADIFGPGKYTLKTENIPIITKLMSWKYGFNSPFKAEVYFVNTRQFNDNKWGTASPIMKDDAKFGVVRLKAFGSFLFSIGDPAIFVRECLGTPSLFKKDYIINQLRSIVVSCFTDALGEAQFSALNLAAKYNELGYAVKEKATVQASLLGLNIPQVLIENISLPTEVEKMLDNRTSMNILGEDLSTFTQFQTANMIGDAAKTPNTMGGFAAGLASMGAITGATHNAINNPAQTQLVCPHCGGHNNQGVKFCGHCGKSLKIEKVQCASCHAQITAGLKFCPECGANQVGRNCPKCGAKAKPSDRFCIDCGTKLNG